MLKKIIMLKSELCDNKNKFTMLKQFSYVYKILTKKNSKIETRYYV